MNLLVHICCAPCFTYPRTRLIESGIDFTGFAYNPNIHPFVEYKNRLFAVRDFSKQKGFEVIYRDEYGLDEFVKGVIGSECRCEYCYTIRMLETARMAKEGGFDGFTTSLLVSPYQKHEVIKSICESAAKQYDINFYYEDFRVGWSESQRLSREYEMYRQKYCGCIFSEKERFCKKLIE